MSPLTWVKSCIRRVILGQKFPTSVIYDGATLDQASILGNYSVLFRNVALVDSTLGAYSYIQSGSIICNTDIGKFCSIASNVSIGLADHPTHMVSTSPVFYDNAQPLPKFLTNDRIVTNTLPRTIVGSDVWIGQGVMIKAGVSIGIGAVIGAGAIVTRDIPPYVIAAGNPCRKIRERFTEDIVNRLISSEWWTRTDCELEHLSSVFPEPIKLLKELET